MAYLLRDMCAAYSMAFMPQLFPSPPSRITLFSEIPFTTCTTRVERVTGPSED